MKSPDQGFQPNRSSVVHRTINRVMGRSNEGQITEPIEINVDPSHQRFVDPADVWGLKAGEQTASVDEPALEGLPPSREVFEETLRIGDPGDIISALEAASRTLIARTEAATDEAIRELRERGASDEEIKRALREDGWELTEFGTHPIARKRPREYEQIIAQPKDEHTGIKLNFVGKR